MPLVFPGSSRKKSDEPLNPYELTFRDGKRIVPPHVAHLMTGLDTVRFTYDDALRIANNRLATNYVNDAHGQIMARHFAERDR